MTEIDLVYQTRLENPEKLIHNVKNAATHSDGQIDLLAKAFKKFGFIGSVIVGRDNVILAGHGRVLAALKAGMPEIPVTDVSHLTDDEQAAYMIAENKLAELKGWDQEVLDQEITRLTALDFDLGDLGFIDDVVTEFNGPGPREHSEEPGKHSEDEQWDTDDDEDGESREERLEAKITDPDNPDRVEYSRKIVSPIYTPKGEKPQLTEIYDLATTRKLLAEIESRDIPEVEKEFLRHAAYRHTVFNYHKAAEYYSHAPKEIQELMEDSALVIIDFKKALEKGFVVLSEGLAEAYANG